MLNNVQRLTESDLHGKRDYLILFRQKEGGVGSALMNREALDDALHQHPQNTTLLRAVSLDTLFRSPVSDPLMAFGEYAQPGDFAVVRISEVAVQPVTQAWSVVDE